MGKQLNEWILIGAVAVGLVAWWVNNYKNNRSKHEGLKEFDAVGGHGSKLDKGPPIQLSADGSKIFKPFQPAVGKAKKSRGELEVEFYAAIQRHPLRKVTPKFYGVINHDQGTFLALENLTYGMEEPCVLDLKMGTQTYDENASEEKVRRERQKYPPQEKIGFRIVGMRTKHGDSWFKSSREWCMSLDENTMHDAILKFFWDGKEIRVPVVKKLLRELKLIGDIITNHSRWRLYGSSLLIIFDAAKKECVYAKMIDFAHVFPIKENNGKDYGYLSGLAFLEKCLNQMAQPSQTGVGGAHANITSNNGRITKKEDKPALFDSEVSFYRAVTSSKDSLGTVMPTLIEVVMDTKPRQLILSDVVKLVAKRQHAISVMDVKIGRRSFVASCSNTPCDSYYNKYATFEKDLNSNSVERIWVALGYSEEGPPSLKKGQLGKRDYLRFRDATTTSEDTGFRLTALINGDYKVTQNESRSIETRTQFIECLERFLSDQKGFSRTLAQRYLVELANLQQAIEKSKIYSKYEMVGTSLLFVHCDGKAVIRWIDFANTLPRATTASSDDNGVEQGVQNLGLAISEIIDKYYS